ncbi:MAG: TIGR04279 domain-containing protein [Methanotrichaceae archaeon]
MRAMLICFLLLSAGAAAQNYSSSYHSCDPVEGNWTQIEGTNFIRMPVISLARPDTNWTYPYDRQPVSSSNETISGIFFGSSSLANATVEICIAPLNSSAFLSAVNVLDLPVDINCSGDPFRLNSSGDLSFAMPGRSPGIYALYVIDKNATVVLSASLIIVAEEKITVEVPSEIPAGFPLEVKVQTSNRSDGRSRHYGAFLVPSSGYEAANLTMTGNGTRQGTWFAINVGADSVEIPGDLDVSMDLLMELLVLFPHSTVALQDTTEQEAELYLITEPDWEPGTYILTSAVLVEDGIIGLEQVELELI